MNAMGNEDQFLKDLFKEGESKTSLNITEKVMHRIDHSSKVFEYKPLISKRNWIVMGSLFFITLTYLIMKSEGLAISTPELIQVLNGGFLKVKDSFSLDWKPLQLPEVPSTLLIAIGAFNIIGLYLIASYKWKRGMFSK
ncbi:MAG: hypothetical protein KTR30_13930 [Saprospiraceae bacterium]|nr:hypothetical protein [Saprospiraceae bacterium]